MQRRHGGTAARTRGWAGEPLVSFATKCGMDSLQWSAPCPERNANGSRLGKTEFR